MGVVQTIDPDVVNQRLFYAPRHAPVHISISFNFHQIAKVIRVQTYLHRFEAKEQIKEEAPVVLKALATIHFEECFH